MSFGVSCSAGLSGVIFAIIVAETHHTGVQRRTVYGIFSVPAGLYPWILLVLWQLLLPQISFWSHLSGILVGTAYSRGFLRSTMPGLATFQARLKYDKRWSL